jgi:hypothetical protein
MKKPVIHMALDNAPGTPILQRYYYEHIISNRPGYVCTVNYITDIPSNWAEEEENR